MNTLWLFWNFACDRIPLLLWHMQKFDQSDMNCAQTKTSIGFPGILFTKWRNVSSWNLVKAQIFEKWVYICKITMTLHWCIDCTAVKMSAKFQNNPINCGFKTFFVVRCLSAWWVKALGLYSLRRRRLTGIGIPMINLRRSDDHLRFIMGIPILIRRHFLSE